MYRIRKGKLDLCALGFKGIVTPTDWNAVLFNK